MFRSEAKSLKNIEEKQAMKATTTRNGLPAPPRRSPRRSNDRTGGVYRPAPEPKDHDCMTGATSNWPISKVKTPTITARSFGHEAC